MQFPGLKGVIFDVDGTLVDSNDHHAHAWCDALAEFGRDVPFETVRPLIGMGGEKLLPKVTGIDSESDEGKKISKRRTELFQKQYLPKVQPFPDAHELLVHLRELGLKLVVATSAKKDELEGLLKIVDAVDLFGATTTSSDAENSKPDPDIVAAALEKLGCKKADVVMIGDTPYDVEAATRTGIATIALRCGGWDDGALKDATAVFDGPRDLLESADAVFGAAGKPAG
jgi:HAD superfamily hydrolase (TIGR01549 family)